MEGEDYLALSGIQHFAFCRRQWALIHIEQVWGENLLTAEGSLMHKRAHDGEVRERRGDTITVRGLYVLSHALGLSGVCDVVEFHADEEGHPICGESGLWLPYPVEYKRGRSKACDADRLQLCAQAICLEEMFGRDVTEGALYYGETRSREVVPLGSDLREQTLAMSREMHALYQRRHTPRARENKSCRSCSLQETCQPKAVAGSSALAYVESRIKEVGL